MTQYYKAMYVYYTYCNHGSVSMEKKKINNIIITDIFFMFYIFTVLIYCFYLFSRRQACTLLSINFKYDFDEIKIFIVHIDIGP